MMGVAARMQMFFVFIMDSIILIINACVMEQRFPICVITVYCKEFARKFRGFFWGAHPERACIERESTSVGTTGLEESKSALSDTKCECLALEYRNYYDFMKGSDLVTPHCCSAACYPRTSVYSDCTVGEGTHQGCRKPRPGFKRGEVAAVYLSRLSTLTYFSNMMSSPAPSAAALSS
jgi:hypothetical protein